MDCLDSEFIPFKTSPWGKQQLSLPLTWPAQSWILQDPLQMVGHLYTWKYWTTERRLGCLISDGNRKPVSPRPCWNSLSISLKYLLSIHPFICGDNRADGFFVGCAWLFSGGRTIKVKIKARNNYSCLCVGEWQQWKAHCQLCVPSVAWAKDVKAGEDKEVDTEVEGTEEGISSHPALPWSPFPRPEKSVAWYYQRGPLPNCTCSGGGPYRGIYTGLNEWLAASLWTSSRCELLTVGRKGSHVSEVILPPGIILPIHPTTHVYSHIPVYSLPSP